MSEEITVRTSAGDFAGIDFGGSGRGALLLHNTMGNAEIWRPAAETMREFCHPVAIDFNGHGQTDVPPMGMLEAAQVLGEISDRLGFDEPLAVGEETGGWVITVATVRGHLKPGALLLLEAAYVGNGQQMRSYVEQFDAPEMVSFMTDRLLLGRTVSTQEREDLIDQFVAASHADWVFAGVETGVLRAMLRRALVPVGEGLWQRRPTVATAVHDIRYGLDPELGPTVETYARLRVPVWFVAADSGLYARFRTEIESFVAADPLRHLTVVPGESLLPVKNAELIAELSSVLVRDEAPLAPHLPPSGR